MAEHQAQRLTTDRARAYLDVPYAEKDEAKQLGARWDPAAKRWYDPRPPTRGLDRWAARPDIPELLPGEDREFGQGLFVDLVPRTCWFTNVRTCVCPQDWERLRRMITRRAGRQCEACGAGEDRESRRWLEAHERWAYDERTGTQTLRRLICLCSPCHLVTHFGHANVTDRTHEALTHLQAVTGMDHAHALAHVHAAEDIWLQRSARVWTLDLTMLTAAGISLAEPQSPGDRAVTADRELRAQRLREQPPRTVASPEPATGRPGVPPATAARRWLARLLGRS